MLKKTNYKKQICTGPAQCSEKRLLKLFAVSAKSLKTMQCLPKIFFNLNVMDLSFTVLYLHFL